MSPAIETIPITNFVDYVDKNAVYKNCDVICVTHAKNLKSVVLHEYLHVVIRDPRGSRWRRLLVERQKKQDQVIIGLWPWQAFGVRSRGLRGFGSLGSGSSGSSGGGTSSADDILPLLMRNITIQPSTLTLVELAHTLVAVHNKAPRYALHSYNCFWYSAAVYTLLERFGQKNEWIWDNFRRWFLVPGGEARYTLNAAAEEFRREMVHSPFRGVRGMGKEGTEPIAVAEGEGELGNESPEGIVDVLSEEDEVNEATFRSLRSVDLINDIDDTATRAAIQERKADLTAFADSVLATPDQEENLRAYWDAVNQRQSQIEEVHYSPAPEVGDFIAKLQAAAQHMSDVVPSAEEEERFDEAINVFVGSVLRQMSQPVPEAFESE